jgi:hypothetical protein
VIVRIANLQKGRLNESGKVHIGMDVHQATISATVMNAHGKPLRHHAKERKVFDPK